MGLGPLPNELWCSLNEIWMQHRPKISKCYVTWFDNTEQVVYSKQNEQRANVENNKIMVKIKSSDSVGGKIKSYVHATMSMFNPAEDIIPWFHKQGLSLVLDNSCFNRKKLGLTWKLSLSPVCETGPMCFWLKAALSRPIGEWVLWCHTSVFTAPLLFKVFCKFFYEIYVIQPNQSDCERMTMPLVSVSLGLLSKMPVWMLNEINRFLFLVRIKQTKRTKLQVWTHPRDYYRLHTLLKIKVLYWYWWFHEEPFKFMEPFHCTKGSI